jgi:outer membrane receptor protein involved in Fe transport
VDGFSLLRGAHQLKFGVDYRHLSTHTGAEPFVQTVDFLDLGTDPFGVQSGAINFYTNDDHGNYHIAFQNFSLYAQDSWKLKPRVTLTYGVRWDVNPPFHASGSPGIFTVQNLNDPPNLSLAPAGTPFYSTTWHNVAPRVGVAVQLSNVSGFERVLRAGFGMFYDIGAGSLAQSFAGFPNRQEADFIFQSIPFPIPANIAVPPPFTTAIPPSGIPQIYATEPDLQLPRTYQWNVAVDQSLGGNQILTFTYVASIGRDLLRQFNLYKPNPNFVNVQILQNSATSDYHALQVQYQRRLTNGLQALGFYSWSHSIDDAMCATAVSSLLSQNARTTPAG